MADTSVTDNTTPPAPLPAEPFWKQAPFYITLGLMPLVYIVVFMVLSPNNTYSTEVRVMVITAIIGLLSAITGYWLASSWGSSKKDAALVAQAGQPTTVVNNQSPAPSVVNSGTTTVAPSTAPAEVTSPTPQGISR